VFQPDFDDPRYNGINPYALGFEMMQDIEGITTRRNERGRPRTAEQLKEDKEWFPEIAANGNPWGTLKEIWKTFRDDHFVHKYLSPRLIRKKRFFRLLDDTSKPEYLVDAIHEPYGDGYQNIRRGLAEHYDPGLVPDIQIVDVNLRGNRKLRLHHIVRNGVKLERTTAEKVLKHLAVLWGFPVVLDEVLPETGDDGKPLPAGGATLKVDPPRE
jgi:spore cortex formation protein SpoVR/YcgB (stage V sporulation)